MKQKKNLENKKNIFAINGSASTYSSNFKLIQKIKMLTENEFCLTIFNDLTKLPHFKTELTSQNTPKSIVKFRNTILKADGILICTPEYILGIPSGLKNALEWCVSTTCFSNKPIGLITASASGLKGHEQLQLIMKTVETNFTEDTTLLIQGLKGKINKEGKIIDEKTNTDLIKFINSFIKLNDCRKVTCRL